MPLTEINVTDPKPALASYWRACEAARAAPPPPPWPAIDPGLLEEGRPRLPAFPLKVFPGQWREWVKRRRALGGLVGGLHRAGPAGVRRRPVRPGRLGAHHRGVERAADPVAGAGRRPVLRQDAGARMAAPSARHGRARAGARGRRAGGGLRCRAAGAGEGRGQTAAGRAAVARRADRLAGRAGAQEPARREPARRLPRHLGRDRPAVGPRRQARGQHRGLARSGAARRGAWKEPATAWPRASSMSGPAPRPTARCAR